MQFIQKDIQRDKTSGNGYHHCRHKGVKHQVFSREIKTGKGIGRQRRNHDYSDDHRRGIKNTIDEIVKEMDKGG